MLKGACMQGNHIIIIIIIILAVWALIERKLIVTTRYTIASAKYPKKAEATSFVLLADLHNQTFGKNNQRLAGRIEELNPDYIFVAGDMINKKEAAYPSNAYDLLEKLAKKYMIYYAYGNHEQRMEQYGDKINPYIDKKASGKSAKNSTLDQEKLYSTWVEFKDRLDSMGVIFLDNESVSVAKKDLKYSFTGMSIGTAYFERYSIPDMETEYLKNLISSDQHGEFHILIAHNPFYFPNYLEWGADLVVSGHFHGGMVRLPGIGGMISPQAKFFPKYDAGLYEDKGKHMVVSRGLGSHSIMPRLFNAPELIYIELKSKD
jgi:predicted MPP superfamily phosphohydrolase